MCEVGKAKGAQKPNPFVIAGLTRNLSMGAFRLRVKPAMTGRGDEGRQRGAKEYRF